MLSHAQNAVSWLALYIRSEEASQKYYFICPAGFSCSKSSERTNNSNKFHFWHSNSVEYINEQFFPERGGVRTISGIVRKLDL